MDRDYKNEFELLWKDFIVLIKGNMMRKSGKQPIPYSVARLIVNEHKGDWGVSDNRFGRWLRDYLKDEPDKGKLVAEILEDDMCIKEITEKKDNLRIFGVAVPVVSGAVGLGVTTFFNLNKYIRTTSAIVPLVVGAVSMKSIIKNKKESHAKALIDAYISQLDKYKKSVLSILES